jgi:ABC-type transport system involved in multi-copper enzyme maturation permease subunit
MDMLSETPISVGWFRKRETDSARRWSRRQRLCFVAILAGLFLTWWWSGHFKPILHTIVWAAWLIGLVAYLRYHRVKIFGPVCFHDLVRTGRQARYTVLRGAYVCILLFTLAWVYAAWFTSQGGNLGTLFAGGTLNGRDLAWFAESFFLTFVWVQFAAALLLTPIYVGSSLTDEKERRTLDGVLASDLEDQEIILGKVASRLAHLLLVLLAGLPVMAFTQFLGGVAPELVLASFVVTATTVLSLASLSILTSVYATRTANAVMATYLWVLALFHATLFLRWMTALINYYVIDRFLPLILDMVFDMGMPDWIVSLPYLNFGNPVLAVYDFFWKLNTGTPLDEALIAGLAEYLAFHALFTVFFCYRAVRKLRPIALQPEAPKPLWRRSGVEFPPRRHRPRLGRWPPLLWKEIHADAPIGSHRFSALLMYLYLVMGWFLVAYYVIGLWTGAAYSGSVFDDGSPFDWKGWLRLSNGLSSTLGTMLATVMLGAVAFYAAGSISRERERQTLDALLTLPVDSGNILFAKFLGNMLAMRQLWWCLGIVWGLGVLTGGVNVLALPLLVLAWWIYAAFLTNLGLWFSLNLRNTLHATVGTLAAVFLLSVFCRLAALNFQGLSPEWLSLELTRIFDVGLYPPVAFTWLCFPYSGNLTRADAGSADYIRACLIGLVIYSSLAWGLWKLNLRRFRRVTFQEAVEPRSAPGVEATPGEQPAGASEMVKQVV